MHAPVHVCSLAFTASTAIQAAQQLPKPQRTLHKRALTRQPAWRPGQGDPATLVKKRKQVYQTQERVQWWLGSVRLRNIVQSSRDCTRQFCGRADSVLAVDGAPLPTRPPMKHDAPRRLGRDFHVMAV
jgi:hypothetical protein